MLNISLQWTYKKSLCTHLLVPLGVISASLRLLKHTEVGVCSHSAHVEKISTLWCEISAVSQGIELNTHLQTAHIPDQTNRREWSFLLPNPPRNAQHAVQMVSGRLHAVFSVSLPWLNDSGRWYLINFLVCRSSGFTSKWEFFYCLLLQNVKNAEECYAHTANLLSLQTIKIASPQCWQLTCQWGHLLHRNNFKKTAKLKLLIRWLASIMRKAKQMLISV